MYEWRSVAILVFVLTVIQIDVLWIKEKILEYRVSKRERVSLVNLGHGVVDLPPQWLGRITLHSCAIRNATCLVTFIIVITYVRCLSAQHSLFRPP